MKIENHFNFRNVLLPLFAAILFCGCSTSSSKHSSASAETQTAGARQVIVIPVLILSSPEENSPVDRRESVPDFSRPSQSTHGWKIQGVPEKS